MVSEKIINFSKYFILNKKNIPNDQNLLENFVSNNHFEDLLISLAKVDPYDFKISDEFLKLNAISSLPHLRILKTSLNLTTERFILELSYLVSPFNKNLSTELKLLSSKISNTNFGSAKLISNLLNSSKNLFYKKLILDFEQKKSFSTISNL